MEDDVTTTTDTERTDALVERLFGATVGALELLSIHLGGSLGLYDELAGGEPLTPPALAERAGIDRRYAREWLEQQAVAGFLEVENDAGDANQRVYRLPAEHATVLADRVNGSYLAPFGSLLAGIGEALPQVVEAYRSGGGVPYAEYGAAFRHGQGAINRPAFTRELPRAWLPSVADVHVRLQAEPPARVAELGCGQGWASLGVAQAYPSVRVDGFDLDEASIEEARAAAARAGLGDRVRFEVRDAAELAADGPYDLILILETLHDLARPVEALAAARTALADGGSVLVGDERVAERFTAPGDEVERMMYGWSVLHCLPTQLVEQASAATGTVMRADAVRGFAEAAGLARVEVLPIENDLFRFYRLRP
jgi:2-polyprenyl-3-methyl-5-hydroxy-6-metoxy-1,4-benzoquinol methylase